MSEEYLRQMRQLEEQQQKLRQEQQSEDRDRYSTVNEQINQHDYKRIVNAKISIAPTSAETLNHYIEKLKIHHEISYEKNWMTHVDNGKRTWHTHKFPMGCFMCEDQAFIGVLIQVLELIHSQNPNIKF